MEGRMRIGISSCLLGERVRYDGGHKQDRFLTDVLGPYVEWVPVCPELEVGMGVPREAVRLVASASAPRMVGIDSGEDWTDRMLAYSKRRVEQIGKLKLSGYVLKSKSPSCGTERVKVHYPEGIAEKDQKDRRDGKTRESGKGLFAGILIKGHPLLPVEEEGRLNDPIRRDHFIERVCAYHRWQALLREGLTPARLAAFHARHELELMTHGAGAESPLGRRMGRLAAGAGRRDPGALAEAYGAAFMAALARKATRRSHAHVLQHLLGCLRRALERDDRAELAEVIGRYRQGLVPLAVPVTLLQHHFRRHPDPRAAGQTYLDPDPSELMLRNSV